MSELQENRKQEEMQLFYDNALEGQSLDAEILAQNYIKPGENLGVAGYANSVKG